MENKKTNQLKKYAINNEKHAGLTTNQGLKMAEDEFSLKSGLRGPTLMEDFHFREKMTHFDHERIPERVVHARGVGAHGIFQLYESLGKYTRADFLTDPSKITPVFVRFSTVQGSRGSSDTVRDVRGFATKFYTDEGNFDLVGNNMPVFFIQDAIKFPDFVHAVKPEPHNEIPQGASAHDTFWDFIGQNHESAHMIMWHMSDRAIPRSLRMMEGFGVHTFRLVNAEGKAHFVKFHWKPTLGVHSLVWDEAQKIAGKNPDFHRQDLYEAIEKGDFPEWELGLQIIREEDEHAFDFDILDPTKIWPEEEVPVKIVGKMTLNRNVDNFFAETEQVAFHPGHVVPGIDFSNDPLLQGRLFSYTDTQLSRLGGPNFHQIPINQPVCPFHNNQRDGMHQMTIHHGQTSYHRNGLNANQPQPVPVEKGGYEHYQEKVEGNKIRGRSESFLDFYSQAKLFYNSLAPYEQQHVKDAFSFELGKCKSDMVKYNAIDLLNHIDRQLAKEVAENIGSLLPEKNREVNSSKKSPALSMANTVRKPDTKSVAVLLNGKPNEAQLSDWIKTFVQHKINYSIVDKKVYPLNGMLKVTDTYDTADPCLFDAILLMSSGPIIDAPVLDFIETTYKHYKPLGLALDDHQALEKSRVNTNAIGVYDLSKSSIQLFIEGIAQGRFWDRN
ncbi:catalase [Heyndrickxia sporothermodurans]|uniref:Catalase n=1 Tax=Heyndrickxia sporothermodurans TaxID=46224 RepID=A0A150KKH9_9BACI|nr:catalase [Heyndrickxia sporothermodurans]KYC90338.1 Catalase [Heyndrickxia sporothermodurans]MBL5771049.1 catalase [Heyndrickxia sporothermodurans]MBL5774718.1 catalase [Heyndrickxia sporothermodurans]MBL5778176.1 catalase [Heyndrickxia sporothermodurans]MBL5785423.1 catalase [Heyndrickxia sporothermodurans]